MNRRTAFRALGVGPATIALGCAAAPAAQAQQMAHPQKAMVADQAAQVDSAPLGAGTCPFEVCEAWILQPR